MSNDNKKSYSSCNPRTARDNLAARPALGSRIRPRYDLLCVERPRLASDLGTAVKHDNRRNSAYRQLCRRFGRRFCVQLGEDHPRRQQTGGGFECGCHHAAWATPRRPKVDNNWEIASRNEFVKILVSEFDRHRWQQGLFAPTADWLVRQFRRRQSVYRGTLGTYKIHVSPPYRFGS